MIYIRTYLKKFSHSLTSFVSSDNQRLSFQSHNLSLPISCFIEHYFSFLPQSKERDLFQPGSPPVSFSWGTTYSVLSTWTKALTQYKQNFGLYDFIIQELRHSLILQRSKKEGRLKKKKSSSLEYPTGLDSFKEQHNLKSNSQGKRDNFDHSQFLCNVGFV